MWCHLYVWGCWCFSPESWFQSFVLHPAWNFAWCTLHVSYMFISKACLISITKATSSRRTGTTLGPIKPTSRSVVSYPSSLPEEGINLATLYWLLNIMLNHRENSDTHHFLPERFPSNYRIEFQLWRQRWKPDHKSDYFSIPNTLTSPTHSE